MQKSSVLTTNFDNYAENFQQKIPYKNVHFLIFVNFCGMIFEKPAADLAGGYLMKRLKKSANKGFTLAEMLIVVAILAILTAVAAPNVAKYSKSIKLRELDDSARAIYMAAEHDFKSKIR